jgi:energy-coupling factor transporter ATP-binding protein EcfA2
MMHEPRRVSAVEIEGFRGISSKTHLCFDGPRSKGNSVLITGDNGTGKSSIVGAVEYALQGRLPSGSTPQSIVGASATCRVRVVLSDGTQCERGVPGTGTSAPHSDFAISPFVIRRADIERFWTMQPSQRLTVFREYLRPRSAEGQVPLAFPNQLRTRKTEEANSLRTERDALRARLASLVKADLGVIPKDHVGLNTFAAKYIYRVTPAAYRRMHKDSSFPSPTPASRIFLQLREVIRTIDRLEKELKMTARSTQVMSEDMREIRSVLNHVNSRVCEAFKLISPAGALVEGLQARVGRPIPVSLRLDVTLNTGTTVPSESVLSEASLDLLALLYFFSLAHESAKRGQARLLILDDVLQSVDATIRVSVVEYLLEQFKDWQLMFTVHDRLWLEQVRAVMQRLGHRFVEFEIERGDADAGPVFIRGAPGGADAALVEALQRDSPQVVCMHAGMLLERLSNELSYALPTSVVRKRRDRYTLADLWPSVHKILSKTECGSAAEEVNKWLHLRNMVGAHYNEWAQSLSRQEARSFGESVKRLLHMVSCSECGTWLERSGGRDPAQKCWSCCCGKKKVTMSAAGDVRRR